MNARKRSGAQLEADYVFCKNKFNNKWKEGFFVELSEYKHLIEEMQSAVVDFRGSL